MIRDRVIDKNAAVARQTIAFPFDDIGNSVSGLKRGSFKPGYAFQVVDVQHFVRDTTATFTYDVKIGTTSCLSGIVTPADATRASATLHATLANRRGGATGEINLELTTNGSGAAEEGCVYVTIRPYPMQGD